jgi:hypothetical protein
MKLLFAVAVAMATMVFTLMNADGSVLTPLRTVSGTAKRTMRAPGTPKYSDVCFSARFRRPVSADDLHDTFRDATAFHATRLDWVYSSDPAWIAECKKRGFWFGGALNTILTDAPKGKTRDQGRILDTYGQRVAAPWMRSWNGYWGCVNSPQYRETFLAHAKLLIDGGADAIQMDDPGINAVAVRWGGCYCRYCKEKAKKKGIDLTQDMLAFQTESVKEFYGYVRHEIDRYAGHRVPWSSNNWDGRSGFPFYLFDYGIAELPQKSAMPDELYRKFSAAAKLGRRQIFTFVSTSIPLTRRVIATAYACGGQIIVPYDVYNGDQPRIFGKPEEYADLYGFARANSGYLDRYEDAAVSGKGIIDARYESNPPVNIEIENVFAFVRAQPGRHDAPVVIHLVDWRDVPQPFVLKLRTDRFFGSKPITVKLSVPSPFDQNVHAKASNRNGYSSLRRESVLQTKVNGDYTYISLPALNPWGIIVVTPKEY